MGDHTETLQIDFDPGIVSFEKLLGIYWSSHNPCITPYSRQYMSIVFYHDDKQERISQEMKEQAEAARNKTIHTEIRPYNIFYLAENYHQKYYLQLNKEIMADFNAIYLDFKDFIDSTAAARINGYVKGLSDMNSLLENIERFGLSEKGRKRLIEIVESYGR